MGRILPTALGSGTAACSTRGILPLSGQQCPPSMKPSPMTTDYAAFLSEVKGRIQAARVRAGRAVNRELVGLYWDIGRSIVEKQEVERWGESVVERLAADLSAEFP